MKGADGKTLEQEGLHNTTAVLDTANKKKKGQQNECILFTKHTLAIEVAPIHQPVKIIIIEPTTLVPLYSMGRRDIWSRHD